MLLLSLLFALPVAQSFEKHARIHYSDIAKLKCDALPFRTAYKQAHCHFAVTDSMSVTEAEAACARIFTGAVLATNVEADVWSRLGVNRTLYHRSSASEGEKRVLCVYSNDFNCDQDTTSIIPGRCTIKAERQMNYAEAVAFCAARQSELPTIANDAENQLVTAEIGNSAIWTNLGYNKKWSNPERSFGRFATCQSADQKNLLLGRDTTAWCPVDTAAAVDPSGYWAFAPKNSKLDVLCVRNAKNAYFIEKPRPVPTGAPPTTRRATKPTAKPTGSTFKPITCVSLHIFNKQNGKCEWTGPANACAQLTSNKGETMFVHIDGWPTKQKAELDMMHPYVAKFNDLTVQSVVRLGCTASYYSHRPPRENKLPTNLGYGVHVIPAAANGKLKNFYNGLTIVNCACDPKKVTLTRREVPKCRALHRFNKETGKCEWTGPANACAQLINNKNQSMFVQIDYWPFTQGTEIDLVRPISWMTKFNDYTVRTVVRLGCMATYYSHGTLDKSRQEARLLTNVRYGEHIVPARANGKLTNFYNGLTRVYCVCDRYGTTLTKREPPKCAETHKLNAKSGMCEWTGPKDGCVELVNHKKARMFITIPNYPTTSKHEIDLNQAKNYEFNDHTVKAVVRNGCRASFYDHSVVARRQHLVPPNQGYGVYDIPCKDAGTLKNFYAGLTRIECSCRDKIVRAIAGVDPVLPVTLTCAEHHQFNNKTKRCEWTQKPEYCGQITNDAGKQEWLTIPNWPTNRRYDVNYWTSKMQEFDDRIVRIVVRQHCFALLDPGFNRPEYFLPLAYGAWGVPSFSNAKQKTKTKEAGVTRIRCECIY